MSTKDRPEQPLRVSEAAQRLGLSQHSVRLLIKQGHLSGFKLGPHWRVWPHALDAAIRSAEERARSGRSDVPF